MSNTLAIALGILVFLFLAIDYALYDWAMTIVLGIKLGELTEYIAFWR